MERFLKGGAELNIAEKGVFQIKDEIGRGASCIVYLAECVDDEGNHIECLLKEYNPKNIVLYREESGELCLDSEEDRGLLNKVWPVLKRDIRNRFLSVGNFPNSKIQRVMCNGFIPQMEQNTLR